MMIIKIGWLVLAIHLLLSVVCYLTWKLSERYGYSLEEDIGHLFDTEKLVIIAAITPGYNVYLTYLFIRSISVSIREDIAVKKILKGIKKKSPDLYEKIMSEYKSGKQD
jgi:hypothetical protein